MKTKFENREELKQFYMNFKRSNVFAIEGAEKRFEHYIEDLVDWFKEEIDNLKYDEMIKDYIIKATDEEMFLTFAYDLSKSFKKDFEEHVKRFDYEYWNLTDEERYSELGIEVNKIVERIEDWLKYGFDVEDDFFNPWFEHNYNKYPQLIKIIE